MRKLLAIIVTGLFALSASSAFADKHMKGEKGDKKMEKKADKMEKKADKK